MSQVAVAEVTDVRTDKVFLEILNNRLNGITSEMGHIIHKASFTPLSKKRGLRQALVTLKARYSVIRATWALPHGRFADGRTGQRHLMTMSPAISS